MNTAIAQLDNEIQELENSIQELKELWDHLDDPRTLEEDITYRRRINEAIKRSKDARNRHNKAGR